MVFVINNNAYGKYTKLAQTGFQFSVSSQMPAQLVWRGRQYNWLGVSFSVLQSGYDGFDEYHCRRDLQAKKWFADINHNALSAAYRPMGGRLGVFGLVSSVLIMVKSRVQWFGPNSAGYIDTHILQPSAMAIGFGYAKSLSSQFAIGAQIKYAGQQLGNSIIEIEDSLSVRKYRAFSPAFDFGTHFKTGWKSIVFGMSVRNFSKEIKYEDEGFQLPLTFQMGISMNLMDFVQVWRNCIP
jgi:hypothetical protein